MAKKISDKQQENIELKAAKNALKNDLGDKKAANKTAVKPKKAAEDTGFVNSLKNFGFTKSHLGYGLALVLVLALGVLGAYIVKGSEASEPASGVTKNESAPSMYFSPANTNISKEQTFTLQLKANSESTSVNAVQATISYPADMVEVVKIDHSVSAYKIDVVEKFGDGKITVARGQIGGLTGDNLVASITFKAKPANGTANIQFVNETSLLSSSTNTSIVSLDNAKQATVKITN